jgi:hypothetical protein
MRRHDQGDVPGNPRTTLNSQHTAQTAEQKDGDDDDHSPLQIRRRMISGAKTFSLKKSIEAVKDTGSQHIHDPKIGRPIWREIRESVFSALNQVGGGLGDYMAQEAIDGGNTLKVIDGFGGLLGYDLTLIDTRSGKGYMKSSAQTWNQEAYCYNRYVRLMQRKICHSASGS